jgi:YD repeat-containing protein
MKRHSLMIIMFTALLALCTTTVVAAITYEYDGLHRLKRVTFDDGTAIVFEYDAVGNRTLRVMNSDAATVYLSLHVEPEASGIVASNPEMTWYPLDTAVELTAIADGFCTFTGWAGDIPGGHEQDNPLTITMDSYKNVTAHFGMPAGDADRDCDVDLADFARFQRCFDETPVSGGCSVFDLDQSDTVDLADFQELSGAFTGPND